jgi:hypothetical protein
MEDEYSMQRPGSAMGPGGDKSRKFVTPTQGLMPRKGQGLQSNLQNLGGRLMIRAQMDRHKSRMKDVKPVISVDAPWGHDRAVPAPGRGLGGGRRANRPASRPASATFSEMQASRASAGSAMDRGASPSRSHHQSSVHQAPPPDFDPTQLNDEDLETYRGALRLLCRMNNADARGMLESLYRESEDRKLLAGYTGVFPRLDADASSSAAQ